MIIGHLGRDVESRFTTTGEQIASFSVATSKKWKKDGQDYEKVVWFRCTAWGKLGEICNKYLKKGSLVMVKGEMQEAKPYQAKDGTWRCSLELTANTMKMLGSKGSADGGYASDKEGTDLDEEALF